MATIFSFFIVFTVFLTGDCAPKYKNSRGSSPQTVYDQKQEGGYNIQVHLKDFQIIALLGDDASNLGDYDYSYDYSDFTIKPSSNSSSSSTPQEPTSPSTTTSFPVTRPSLISLNISDASLATTSETPKETSQLISSTPSAIIVKESINNNTISNKENAASSNEAISSTSTSSTEKSTRLEEPGKIKVQIIEFPAGGSTVPGEDVHEKGEIVPEGEILQLRKCATGFTRDKRGRCRRVRRPGSTAPQLFGFSQLASNLASRLQTRVSTENSASLEASED